jgi:hypothetical protein
MPKNPSDLELLEDEMDFDDSFVLEPNEIESDRNCARMLYDGAGRCFSIEVDK